MLDLTLTWKNCSDFLVSHVTHGNYIPEDDYVLENFILHPTEAELSWLSFQILVLFLLGILKPWGVFWCNSCSQLHHCTQNREMWGFSYPYQHPAPPALTTPALANTKHWSKLFLQGLIVPENWKQPLEGLDFFQALCSSPLVYRHATDIYFGAFNYLCLADG